MPWRMNGYRHFDNKNLGIPLRTGIWPSHLHTSTVPRPWHILSPHGAGCGLPGARVIKSRTGPISFGPSATIGASLPFRWNLLPLNSSQVNIGCSICSMNPHVEQPGHSAPDYKDEKGSDLSQTSPSKVEHVEHVGSATAVDAATEKRLLRKLDIRIVPMICWIYLMNFMDRGMYDARK